MKGTLGWLTMSARASGAFNTWKNCSLPRLIRQERKSQKPSSPQPPNAKKPRPSPNGKPNQGSRQTIIENNDFLRRELAQRIGQRLLVVFNKTVRQFNLCLGSFLP